MLERFEGVRTIGYLAVIAGIFAGPTAALVMLRPAIFIAMDLSKIVFLTGCMGMPVVAILAAAMLASEVLGSPDEKLDMAKAGPGILTMGALFALVVQAMTLICTGKHDVKGYFVMLLLMTTVGAGTIIGMGFLERLGKKRRANNAPAPQNADAGA
ncbi:hypothetical protein [[Pseudomonas] boreopolis]|uniref:hypothetical protein n=1 Tax=Xanthomonas boreopolis TaxID=86183 RepID=UPI003DA020B6